MLTPLLYTVGWFKTESFSNLGKKGPPPKKNHWEIMCSQANIRNQQSLRHPEVGVSRWHGQTHKQTGGHGHSITYPAQRAESVKSEKFNRH